MMQWHDWSSARRIAALALALALAWDALALVRLGSEDGDIPASPSVVPSAPGLTHRPLDDPRAYRLAAQRSPFGGAAAAPPIDAQVAQAALVQHPRLTGTVVRGANSFVVLEQLDGAVRLLHLGERAAGLTLRSVNPGVATFDDSTGHRVVLRAEASATGTTP